MKKLKIGLLLTAALLISAEAMADTKGENASSETFVLDMFDNFEEQEKEAESNPKVLELKKEITYLESQLEKYMNTPIKSGGGSAYRTTLTFGAEHELTSTQDYKYDDNSHAVSPRLAFSTQKKGSNFSFDGYVSQTLYSGNSKKELQKVDLGMTYMRPTTLFSKPFRYGGRIGFRNHTESTPLRLADINSSYVNYHRGHQRRYEYWFAPAFSFNPTPKLNVAMSSTLRIIDHRLTWDIFGKNENGPAGYDWNVETTETSKILQHYLRSRYQFTENQSFGIEYLFVREDLKRVILNKEQFLLFRYSYKLPNKRTTISPYVRLPIVDREFRTMLPTTSKMTEVREGERPRYGFVLGHSFGNGLSFRMDAHMRADSETYKSSNDAGVKIGKEKKNNLYNVDWSINYTF
ncbi:hypothetical protein [Cetobacterium sp.]|uniref:hypothetical protein n=1 Tax=Cetobacterium sp. TaxID=2071632 RepID=UPI003F31C7F6